MRINIRNTICNIITWTKNIMNEHIYVHMLIQILRTIIPISFLLYYIYIICSAAMQTSLDINATEHQFITISDDVANCYTAPYTFLLSYFLSTRYLRYKNKIVRSILPNTTVYNCNYTRNNIILIIICIVFCAVGVIFGEQFIFAAKGDEIPSWYKYLNISEVRFYCIFIGSIWAMMFIIICTSVKNAFIVYKALQISSPDRIDLFKMYDIFKMDLSIILLYLIGLIININADIRLKILYNVEHGLYSLIYKYPNFFFLLLLGLGIYFAIIITVLIENAKKINKSLEETQTANSEVKNTPFFNMQNIMVFISTAVVPIIALIIQCIQ